MSFPNFKNKHLNDSMISPTEYLEYRRKTKRYPQFNPSLGIIFSYDLRLMEYALKSIKTTKVMFCGKELYLINDTDDKIAITNSAIGAPASCTLLEELIAFGVKNFISIGTAGTLQKEIKIGDLIVCVRAIRDEGTSYHYLPDSKYAYASKKMTEKIKSNLEKLKLKYILGTSWTIDAPYRETVAEAKQYQKEGVATVEMEAAALFAVAEYRKVNLGAIFTISDSLAELEWNPKFHLKKVDIGLNLIYKAALHSLLD